MAPSGCTQKVLKQPSLAGYIDCHYQQMHLQLAWEGCSSQYDLSDVHPVVQNIILIVNE